MKQNINKKRTLPDKPEWKIILSNLIFHDQTMLYRICMKMIIHLDKINANEIYELIETINPGGRSQQREIEQSYGSNWPKPIAQREIDREIVDKVFNIADSYIDDDEMTKLLRTWIYREQTSFLSMVLEKRHAPLAEVVDSLKRFFSISIKSVPLSLDEKIGLRVFLIYRLLSENLQYINVAKHFIKLKTINSILDHVVGPAQGNGKLGGKSAGWILAQSILEEKKKENPIFERVHYPRSWFITSDQVLDFMHYNALEEFVFTKYQTIDEIKQEYPFLEYIFKHSEFPPDARYALNMILDDFEGSPIIVRSSSLLEDSFEAAFSGKYKSLFLSNTGGKEERMNELTNAIKEVYASTLGPDPIAYRKENKLLDFREEMGILIQEVVGTKVGKYYFPSYAGVAFSNNEFRWSPRIHREDGVVRLVAGLGTRAVDRTINDYPLLFSPGQPALKVNNSYQDVTRYSQRYVDVINLETNSFETIEFDQLIKEIDGYYPGLEKVVSFDRVGTLVEPVSYLSDFKNESLVVTFSKLLENTSFVETIKAILHELEDAICRPVDIEFACSENKFYLLQCRPQSSFAAENLVKLPVNIPSDKIIFTANRYVSNGLVENIQYVVYVDSEGYRNCKTHEEMLGIGRIIGELNRILPKRSFILIGPGRWGSKGDIKLGVPVLYSDINNSTMLIEVAKESSGYVPELSFGTHFFQDLVESNIKYLPLYPDKDDCIFNIDFLLKSKNSLREFVDCKEDIENVVRLIKVSDYFSEGGLSIYMDGDKNKAVAFFKNT